LGKRERLSSQRNLVKIAYSPDRAEAELIRGLRAIVEASSSFVARLVLMCRSSLPPAHVKCFSPRTDIAVARDVLRQDDMGDVRPAPPSGADRQSRLIAVLL
jgi:hypothetical protein